MNENYFTNLRLLSNYPDVMSIKDLQSALGIGQNTAYNLINSGEIRSKRIGRQIKILKTAVLEYLDS